VLHRVGREDLARVYGGWWRRNVTTDGAEALRPSAERYLSFALDD
jgi:hypothetical protein